MSKNLSQYKNPQQVDEAVKEILNHYYIKEFNDWNKNGCSDNHIIHSLNILKDLYDQGGPEEVF